MNPKDWLTPQIVAVMAGVSATHIRAEIRAGSIHAQGRESASGKQVQYFVFRTEAERYIRERASSAPLERARADEGRGRPCPACQHSASRVVDARHPSDSEAESYRRRECRRCRHRWTTYEYDAISAKPQSVA